MVVKEWIEDLGKAVPGVLVLGKLNLVEPVLALGEVFWPGP